jgi:predicted glycosyltransferase
VDQQRAGLTRVALYSHDTQGLGHIRRNIAVAAALVAADPATDVLLLTGAPEATALPLPPRTEVLTLPALAKDLHGTYSSRVLQAPLGDVLDLRASVMTAALLSFRPDLLVVDKVARGVGGELDRVLDAVRAALPTKVVLGLREVLDDPAVARAEWHRDGTDEVLQRSYDAVWVYGDPRVYDPAQEYGFAPAVAAMTSYTGYLGRGRSEGTRTRTRSQARVHPPRSPYALCLVGGGQDGFRLAHDFLRAPVPDGVEAVAVSGPYMSAEHRRVLREVAAAGGARLLEFVPDAVEFVAGAGAVVSMAGYNSVCEVLAADRPALLVPRVRPRQEQLVRADRLAALGLVDSLHPDDCTPEAISGWLGTVLGVPRLPRPHHVDLDGLAVVPHLARRLVLGDRAAGAPTTSTDLEAVRVAV